MPTRYLSKPDFERAYRSRILGGVFCEDARYYRASKRRYYRTLRELCRLNLPHPARLLEIGGGQIALLCNSLFDDKTSVVDVSPQFKGSFASVNIKFLVCDLLRDSLPKQAQFDLIILCEIVEHLLAPLHVVLSKLVCNLADGGLIVLTTPNLFRLRNLIRLCCGQRIICNWRYPAIGEGVGHVLEFSAQHLIWQMEQAGLTDISVRFVQLSNAGFSARAQILRALATPLLLRPLWRDNLIAVGRWTAAAAERSRGVSTPAVLIPAV